MLLYVNYATGANHVKRGTHPNSLANLKSKWLPGISANPKGRQKKGDCIIEIARNLLLTEAVLLDGTKFKTSSGKSLTWEELLAHTWLEGALKDPTLRRELHERFYGRVPLPVQSQVSGEITLRVVEE